MFCAICVYRTAGCPGDIGLLYFELLMDGAGNILFNCRRVKAKLKVIAVEAYFFTLRLWLACMPAPCNAQNPMLVVSIFVKNV